MHDIVFEDNCAYNYNANNSDEETIIMPITLIKTTVMQKNNHVDNNETGNNGEKSIREMTLLQTTVLSIKKLHITKLQITPKSGSKTKFKRLRASSFHPLHSNFALHFGNSKLFSLNISAHSSPLEGYVARMQDLL